MKLFGFEIRRANDDADDNLPSFAPNIESDGAVLVSASGYSSSSFLDLEGTLRNEADLVNRYRAIAQYPEIDIAIKNIVNEAIVFDDINPTVDLDLSELESLGVPPKILEILKVEFDNILNILQFSRYGYQTFQRWYIDGRQYFHVIIDEDEKLQQVNGIREIRYLDPRKIRKIKVVSKLNTSKIKSKVETAEYYIYNEKGFDAKTTSYGTDQGDIKGIQIAPDSIIHTTSGITNENENLVLSHLHKAIKPMNQLRCLEDASVIHAISRAPQRRVFYVEVGNLNKHAAEQHLRSMITEHKNRLVYNPATGEIRDDRKMMTMNEDFWFATRNGQGNKIETLQPGPNLLELSNITYFQQKLYQALDVPISRLTNPEGGGFDFGRSSQITRDELSFQKHIDRLRTRFSDLFLQALEKQVILKRIMSPEDWDTIFNKIKFKYARDIHFTELKDREIWSERLDLLNKIAPYIGTMFSQKWAQKNVLGLNEEQLEQMQLEMQEELNMIEQPSETEEQKPKPRKRVNK